MSWFKKEKKSDLYMWREYEAELAGYLAAVERLAGDIGRELAKPATTTSERLKLEASLPAVTDYIKDLQQRMDDARERIRRLEIEHMTQVASGL